MEVIKLNDNPEIASSGNLGFGSRGLCSHCHVKHCSRRTGKDSLGVVVRCPDFKNKEYGY